MVSRFLAVSISSKITGDRICSNGSLNIGGWSFGGTVAFEMAHILQAKNIQIDNLILFDTVTEYSTNTGSVVEKNEIEKFGFDGELQAMLSHNSQLSDRHKLSKIYRQNLVLVKATRRGVSTKKSENFSSDNSYGWDKYAKKIVVYEVFAEHNALFDKENVSSMAIILKKIF